MTDQLQCNNPKPHAPHLHSMDIDAYQCPGIGRPDDIERVEFNHDASDTTKAFIHVKTVGGTHLVIEVERKYKSWIIGKRHNFEVRVRD